MRPSSPRKLAQGWRNVPLLTERLAVQHLDSDEVDMTDPSAITETSLLCWYQGLREGGSKATEKLWRLYFARMVQVAKRKLAGTNRAVHDEEDIALSAFKSFCLGFQEGRFQAQAESENLWPLLVSLTINKSIDHLRRGNRLKRGGRGAAEKAQPPVDSQHVWDDLISTTADPELQVAANEAFENLLETLDQTGDASLKQIVLLTVEGHRPSAIAQQLGGCTVRTIQRKLKTIRAIWEAENS